MISSLKKHSSFIVAAMLFFLIISACQPAPEHTQKAWIDSPFAGSSFFPGSPIHLVAHAYAEKGIAEVQSSIDGVPYSRGAPNNPGDKFALYTQDMIINDPGEHTIELVAFDAQGAQSSPISVQVKILAFTQPAPTDAVPPTLITPTYTPIAPFTPSPTLIIPTYTPSANTPIPPVQTADTQPPAISSVSHTPDKISDFGTCCGPDTLNISSTITDSSGVSNAQVHFRVVNTDGTTGSWVTVSMSGSGSHYQAAIGPSGLMNSLSKYGRGVVQYYITAVDSKGNTAQSGQTSVEICGCVM